MALSKLRGGRHGLITKHTLKQRQQRCKAKKQEAVGLHEFYSIESLGKSLADAGRLGPGWSSRRENKTATLANLYSKMV